MNESLIKDIIVTRVVNRFPALVFDLQEQKKFNSLEDVLFNVELYDMMSNSELLEILNSSDTESKQDSLLDGYNDILKPTKYNNTTKFVHLDEFIDPSQYKDPRGNSLSVSTILNSNYYLYDCNEEDLTLTLVTTPWNNPSKSIGVNIPDFNISVLYVTPFDLRKIADSYNHAKEPFMWDEYKPLVYFKRMLYDAVSKHCTDIHIENHMVASNSESGISYVYEVSYRILTEIRKQPKYTMPQKFNSSLIMSLMNVSGAVIDDASKPKGAMAGWLNPLRNGSVSLRLTFTNSEDRYSTVIRVQKLSEVPKDIDDLGFDIKTSNCLHELATYEEGLTLITGPRGSGKNTTANAIVKEMYTGDTCIYEYSSPLEFIQPFQQFDYKGDKDILAGKIALSKKQDIDIAILNEVPNADIAPAIYDLINSSVGVITTLHIPRLWDLPTKLRDYFGDFYQELYSHLNGVVQQKMFVPLCPHCRVQSMRHNFSSKIMKILEEHDIDSFYECNDPKCQFCGGTGRDNRVQPFAEYIVFDDSIRFALLKMKDTYEQSKYLRELMYERHTSLEDSICEGIRQGLLSPDAFHKIKIRG